MNVKTQNKPLIGILVAIAMALVLSISGIGTALALPDTPQYEPNDPHCLAYQLNEHYSYWAEVDKDKIIAFMAPYCDIKGIENTTDYRDSAYGGYTNTDYMDTQLNLPDGSKIAFAADGNYTVCSEDSNNNFSQDSSFHTCGRVSEPSLTSATFNMHFKATGIQATGFKDYKEAFATLNGN